VAEVADTTELCVYLRQLKAMYKLVNGPLIEERKKEVLAADIKRDIYEQCEKPKSSKEIAQVLGTKPQNINYHLAILTEYGLLDYETKGAEKIYRKAL